VDERLRRTLSRRRRPPGRRLGFTHQLVGELLQLPLALLDLRLAEAFGLGDDDEHDGAVALHVLQPVTLLSSPVVTRRSSSRRRQRLT
jgi:hypothetical protein